MINLLEWGKYTIFLDSLAKEVGSALILMLYPLSLELKVYNTSHFLAAIPVA